jgi:predicted transcriptional regulator
VTFSLNKMVLEALNQGQDKPYLTAREIKLFIKSSFDIDYQIQTIIVVLNRFNTKGTINRCTFAGPEVRERYGYYLVHNTANFRQEKLDERLTAIANEFFNGNKSDALTALNQLQ